MTKKEEKEKEIHKRKTIGVLRAKNFLILEFFNFDFLKNVQFFNFDFFLFFLCFFDMFFHVLYFDFVYF